jgi:hypothetical protein
MDDLINKISKIKKMIWKSSGCCYLFKYFDDLVKDLESRRGDSLFSDENAALLGLIQDYAQDSTYNTYGSVNWVNYSARCFYCADRLVQYLPESSHEALEQFLNRYFIDLTRCAVSPVIQQEVLAKYIDKNLTVNKPFDLYDTLVRKAIDGSRNFRIWDVSEVSLAFAYTKSFDWLIRRFLDAFSDFSVLKVWIPLLGTTNLANIWYEYPDSGNYRHSGTYTRESVSNSLDKMLDLHLSLIDLWYWHNPQEMIEQLPQNDLIEALEVYDDEEFDKTLRHMATLAANDKVKGILEHFAEDDETWIVNLSRSLLRHYQI